MIDHPARARVAEIMVGRMGRTGEEHTRGSGYLVSPGWVLTAHHVVKDAASVGVWLGAPPELVSEEGVGVDPGRVLAVPAADLALLPLGGPADDLLCEPGPVRAAGPGPWAGRADGGCRLPALQAAPGSCPARRAAARAGLRHRQHRRAIGCQDRPVCVRGGCGAGPGPRTGQALLVGGNVRRGRIGQSQAGRRGRPAPPGGGTCHAHRLPRRAAFRLCVRRSAGGLARSTAPVACYGGEPMAGHSADCPEDRGSAGPAGRGGIVSPGVDRPRCRTGRAGGLH